MKNKEKKIFSWLLLWKAVARSENAKDSRWAFSQSFRQVNKNKFNEVIDPSCFPPTPLIETDKTKKNTR